MTNPVKLFTEFVKNKEPRDIIITIPKSIKWSDYQKELQAAEAGEIMNFKVNNFPKTKVGKKCYVLHDGSIKGYMVISGLSEKDFTCTTTGKEWAGKFIERTGKFIPITPVPMKGFQGFRYYQG
jgi:hypothetical protein